MSAEDSVRIIESALGIIIAWASRREFHEEAMRRARCNLSRGPASVLARLNSFGPLRIGELAAMLGIDNSTLTPHAQRLERNGLVTRAPDPHDGRVAVLTITPEGKDDVLVRVRPTETQTRLTPADRLRNVAGAFRVARHAGR